MSYIPLSPSSHTCWGYCRCALPMLRDLVAGKNCCILLYGLTNGGKTFTAQGTRKHPGLLPHTLDVLFDNVVPHLAPRFAFKIRDNLVEPEVRVGRGRRRRAPIIGLRSSPSVSRTLSWPHSSAMNGAR